MAIIDSTLLPHLPRFKADRSLLLTTATIWATMVVLFSFSSFIDGQRAGEGLSYWFYLRGWGLGFLPWLFMMPIVYLYGARDTNKGLFPTVATAAIAAAITLPISGLFNGFLLSFGNDRTIWEVWGSWTLTSWLWDGVLLVATYLAGRQMRPRPEYDPHLPMEAAPSIAVRSTSGTEFIPLTDIQGATAQGNYIALRLAGREVLHRATMSSLSEKLAQSGFVRVHRSHLVNPAYIASTRSRGDRVREVELANGSRIPVSDRYALDINDRLQSRVVD